MPSLRCGFRSVRHAASAAWRRASAVAFTGVPQGDAAVGGIALAAVAGATAAWAAPLGRGGVALAEERTPYFPPPTLGRPFSAVGKTMPADKAGKVAWAVKNLEVGKLAEVLDSWPQGAALLDDDGNTLFHLAASQPERYAAQPEAAAKLVHRLLEDGWSVVDAKNSSGLRAEAVAKRCDPKGPMTQLLGARSHDFHEHLRVESPLALVRDMSPVPEQWEYVVEDEQRRCFAGVMKKAFSTEQCAKWMQEHLEKGAWFQPEGVPRKTAWYVSKDCADCPYRYSGLEYPVTIFPPFMQEIRAEVCRLCGIPPEQYPNSCNVNVYNDQSHEVGWHSDDEVMFQGLAGDTRIISFSLGCSRDFCFRLQGTAETLGSVPLGDGDIMTMEGLFQKHYKHSVPPSDQPCSPRINMTFRWIVVKAHASDAAVKGAAS